MLKPFAVIAASAGLWIAGCAGVPQHSETARMQADAVWITAGEAAAADEAKDPIALQFRREFNLSRVPEQFLVHVSADNRFILYVNGERVADGPSRGDLAHWRYETIDLAPHLVAGANVVAAEVWNAGRFSGLAQINGGRTAFLISAGGRRHRALIDGPDGWRVRIDDSWTVNSGTEQLFSQVGAWYYSAGAPETITAGRFADDWAQPESEAEGWGEAVALDIGPLTLTLVVDALPQMKHNRVPSGRVARSSGVANSSFPDGPVEIPPNSEAAILIDAGRVLAAYPTLVTSGGAGAEIEVTYTEALYDPDEMDVTEFGERMVRFADRARVDDGLARGLSDTMYPDGRAERRLAPYWWRVWRFAEITVTTADEPLTLERLETYETGYPFEQKGRFVSSDPELNRIWQTGWATALLDAHETYQDTAYWEQRQYVGDSRIQMEISHDVAGDARLAVQALDAVNASRWNDGLPQAAWPETDDNVIPPYGLLWLGSLRDYWMRQPDTSVIERSLGGTRDVFDWYTENLSERGLVQESSGWPFVDGVDHLVGWEWSGGLGPEHCVITMMYYGALRDAAVLEAALGDADRAPGYIARAERVRDSLNAHCWDEGRGLYADIPGEDVFSQHAAILAVLYDLVPADQQRAMLEQVTRSEGGIAAPDGITGVSYYFSFYLARAFDHAGMTDRYIDMLTPWRAMVAQNFTTFPENPDPSRSDTHAWSAHPTTGLLTYVAGVQPDAPGFARVRVAPHLGDLTSLDAAMTHPDGLIETLYAVDGDRLEARIVLPDGLSGVFEWGGYTEDLGEGVNELSLRR